MQLATLVAAICESIVHTQLFAMTRYLTLGDIGIGGDDRKTIEGSNTDGVLI